MKKGISLIVLIVTIIVMIIIAGAVIISLTETNIIEQAEIAVEKHNDSEIQTAANLAYSNWLLEEKTGKNPGHVQNYIRNKLVKQKLMTWDDLKNYYISPTGKIEKLNTDEMILVLEIPHDNLNMNLIVEESSGMLIDWGDGTEKESVYATIWHLYDKKGVYEVKITGKCKVFDPSYSGEYLKEIKSFGNLGAKSITIWSSPKLEYIAVPNEKSFENLEDFYMNSSAVEELPDEMFKNCKKLTLVDFTDCKNLKRIPENIFEGCDLLSTIIFTGCTSLENYDALPDEWK